MNDNLKVASTCTVSNDKLPIWKPETFVSFILMLCLEFTLTFQFYICPFLCMLHEEGKKFIRTLECSINESTGYTHLVVMAGMWDARRMAFFSVTIFSFLTQPLFWV